MAAALVGGPVIGWWIGRVLGAGVLASAAVAVAATSVVIVTADIVRRRANAAIRAASQDDAKAEEYSSVSDHLRAPANAEAVISDFDRVPHERWRPRRGAVAVAAAALIIGCGAAGVAAYLTDPADAADRYRVTAVIVQPVTLTSAGPQGAVGRWTAPDGRTRTGKIAVPSTLAAGARHPIWVDRHGTPAGPPSSRLAEVWNAVFVAATTATLAAAAIVAIQRAVRRTSRRGHEEDHLDREWHRVASRWRRRYLR